MQFGKAIKRSLAWIIFQAFVFSSLCIAMPLNPSAKAFWASLGNPKYISAPMVSHSSLPWRMFVRSNGVDLAFTQMLTAKSFTTNKVYRRNVVDWGEYDKILRDDVWVSRAKALDRPLIAQLAGDDAATLLAAGKMLQPFVSAIDLNLGCPQGIARKGNYGAYLLPDRKRVLHIVSTLSSQLDVPITVKIRKLLDGSDKTVDLCRALEQAGAMAITVHGRTVKENKQLTGPVDWTVIRKVKQNVSIPVIANGGIQSFEDVRQCLSFTGADAVMSSEGLLENPALFAEDGQGDRRFREEYCLSQLSLVDSFVDCIEQLAEDRSDSRAYAGHFFKLLHRFFSAPRNADLRDQLGGKGEPSLRAIVQELRQRVQGQDDAAAIQKGFLSPTTWYVRHQKAGGGVDVGEEEEE